MTVVRRDVQVTNHVDLVKVLVLQIQSVRLKGLITFVPQVVQTETSFLLLNIPYWLPFMVGIQVYTS